MLKKAKNFKSLDELYESLEKVDATTDAKKCFSGYAKSCWIAYDSPSLNANFAITKIRLWSHDHRLDVRRKPDRDLINAFDRIGLIRHDINEDAFFINRLNNNLCEVKYPEKVLFYINQHAPLDCGHYDYYYSPYTKLGLPNSIYDFWYTIRDSRIFDDIHFFNENYENFSSPSRDQIKTVKETLASYLTKMEYIAILYRLNSGDKNDHPFPRACYELSENALTKLSKSSLGKYL